jgi:hypothetical protein
MPDAKDLENALDTTYIVPLAHMWLLILAAAFLAITFLQSALDKVFDYKGNLSFMKEQFSKTFLKSTIGFLLPVILFCELITGCFCVFGAILTFTGGVIHFIAAGFLCAGITLLMLLFGQRVSKQYAGAASLTGYFIIVLIGLGMVIWLP